MTSTERQHLDNPVTTALGLICWFGFLAVMFIFFALQRLIRLTQVSMGSDGLSNAQYELLAELADRDLVTRQNEPYFPDPYERDGYTLNPDEVVLLRRCVELGVRHKLIERYAPSYAHNTIIPRTT